MSVNYVMACQKCGVGLTRAVPRLLATVKRDLGERMIPQDHPDLQPVTRSRPIECHECGAMNRVRMDVPWLRHP